MDILSVLAKSGMYLMSLPTAAFIAMVWMVLCLVFRAGFNTSIRSGLKFGVGIVGVSTLATLTINTLQPVVEGLSKNLHLNLKIVDIGVGAILNVFAWPGAFVVMFGILAIGFVLVLLKWTNTLWVDVHNTWHGNYVGLITWVMTGNVLLGIALAFATQIICLKLADYHAKRFSEATGIPNITLIASAAVLPASLSQFTMMLLDKIPGLNKVHVEAEDLQDKLGVFGEPIAIGAIIGAILAILAGYNFSKILNVTITLAAVLTLIPKMAGIIVEGMIPLSTAVTAVMQKRFKGRKLNITVDAAILLGQPSVMTVFVLMIPISIILSFIVPGFGFIPVASLTTLVYYIGAVLPYTRGCVVHTIIVCSVWIILISLIATSMAPIITHGLDITGFYHQQIANGAQFVNWDEGGNIFNWIIHLFVK